eukprot:607210-Amphidinium_carterae.2
MTCQLVRTGRSEQGRSVSLPGSLPFRGAYAVPADTLLQHAHDSRMTDAPPPNSMWGQRSLYVLIQKGVYLRHLLNQHIKNACSDSIIQDSFFKNRCPILSKVRPAMQVLKPGWSPLTPQAKRRYKTRHLEAQGREGDVTLCCPIQQGQQTTRSAFSSILHDALLTKLMIAATTCCHTTSIEHAMASTTHGQCSSLVTFGNQ